MTENLATHAQNRQSSSTVLQEIAFLPLTVPPLAYQRTSLFVLGTQYTKIGLPMRCTCSLIFYGGPSAVETLNGSKNKGTPREALLHGLEALLAQKSRSSLRWYTEVKIKGREWQGSPYLSGSRPGPNKSL
ncbi:hypothetical protein LA080_001549 [Diaporthe eres]|nr:hypothetical protein LA080_001549 [Diaporthe eres]